MIGEAHDICMLLDLVRVVFVYGVTNKPNIMFCLSKFCKIENYQFIHIVFKAYFEVICNALILYVVHNIMFILTRYNCKQTSKY